jgi:hypothetical protein
MTNEVNNKKELNSSDKNVQLNGGFQWHIKLFIPKIYTSLLILNGKTCLKKDKVINTSDHFCFPAAGMKETISKSS